MDLFIVKLILKNQDEFFIGTRATYLQFANTFHTVKGLDLYFL
jgi:hypothetical protein